MEFFEPFTIQYNQEKFPFAETVGDILNIRYLHLAHKLIDVQLATRETDQKTNLHKVFYDDSRLVFRNMYIKFLREVILPHFNFEDVIYQRIPNFRAHLPGSMAVGEFHKDSKYSHSIHEVNIWVPLTRTVENNTIWLESYPDKADYHPFLSYPGECLVFQGGLLTHGNKVNDTPYSRLSLDFRILDPADYNEQEQQGVSVNTGTKLCLGGYFDLLKNTGHSSILGRSKLESKVTA